VDFLRVVRPHREIHVAVASRDAPDVKVHAPAAKEPVAESAPIKKRSDIDQCRELADLRS
jgi:hypothetical protein